MDIKSHILERAKARLEALLAAERRIVETLSEEERQVYALFVLRRLLVGCVERANIGEPPKPVMNVTERAARIEAIRAGTARAITVRDDLARANRLEPVLASPQQRGLVARQMSVDTLRLDNVGS